MSSASGPSSQAIQLGTVVLDLNPAHPADGFADGWTPLCPSRPLRTQYSLLPPPDASNDPASAIDSLHYRYKSGFDAESKLQNGRLVVRCWLTPSDVAQTSWRDRKGMQNSFPLRILFSHLRGSWDDGDGELLLSMGPGDDHTLVQLYAAVPSPSEPSSTSFSEEYDDEVHRRMDRYEEPEGVTTTLYQYQHRSIAKMYRMETQPEKYVDPRWTAMQEVGRPGTYYINLDAGDVQRMPNWYDLPRGGILNEQMGVGKSLICLSLILATLNQPCLPPPNAVNPSRVTTTHREQTYPFDTDEKLRRIASIPSYHTSLSFPSLADICVDILAVHEPASAQSAELSLQLRSAIEGRRTLYYDMPLPDDQHKYGRGAKAKPKSEAVQRIYLANTTLLVCPAILVKQWLKEIRDHLKDGSLKVLEVASEQIPPIETLMQYDVVIMSVQRFAREERLHGPEANGEPSVLTQARWKRLILDEGHIAGSKVTNSMRLAQRLSVERRWAVSGTPTKNLRQGTEAEPVSQAPRPTGLSKTVTKISKVGKGKKVVKTQVEVQIHPRAWSNLEKDDLNRIGVIISVFLQAEPFKSDAGFQERISKHLVRADGPSMGAVRRLKHLMSALMVKHRPNEVDREITLPPCTRSPVLLEFHPMQRVTYNALAGLAASNVYTSEKDDPGCFLHPNNAKFANQVIKNLRLACFWYSAIDMGIAACIRRTAEFLKAPEERALPPAPGSKPFVIGPEARVQLLEATRLLQSALDWPGWEECMQNGGSVPFEGGDLSEAILGAWSPSPFNPDTIDTHSLLVLREANRGQVPEDDLVNQGLARRVAKEAELADGESKGVGKKAEGNLPTEETMSAAKQAKVVSHKSPTRRTKRARPDDDVDGRLAEAERNAMVAQVPDGPRPLPHTIETVSRSAKVNFVIRAILEADRSDKFVIFGDPSELGHLTEALDLFEVKSCFAGYGSGKGQRDQALMDFQRSEVRVCLLDLRLAARGLNLVLANRMIFLSPVWSLDTLEQAVKRCHRLGQTRPTLVQTLIVKDTIEEDIANRAATLRTEAEEKLYSRAMLEKPRFAYAESLPSERFTVDLVPALQRADRKSTPAEPSSDQSPISPEVRTPVHHMAAENVVGQASTGVDEAQPQRKRRRVAFV